ncbi:lysylphosphatidylglycerol synthase domain-containing protein [Marinicella rhabdoformis]|uniref:lysylphosphatidylglycerol synthase domain-containing protein n=1 Tax=Marinicella rhabdoformis TaxID=2580566 RepID=UPI0012AEDC2D|nr:lysylphosphatidylglycerol synthase domain-containing protein [Marinicella rhabdoformis]
MWLKNKNIFKWLGYLLGIGAIYFVIKTIRETGLNWEQLTTFINDMDVLLLLVVLILYVVVMLIGVFIWSLIINTLSQKHCFYHFDQLILVHSRSNIGKYIPGNFMQFVGRNLLGKKLGYTHSNLALSTLIEVSISVFIGSAMMVFIMLSGASNIDVFRMDFGSGSNQLIWSLIAVFALFFIIFFKDKVMILAEKSKLVLKNRQVMFLITVAFCLAYVIMGLCNTVIYAVLDNEVKFIDFMNLLLVYILSWTIGFILPGPPGGLGVREFIFINLLSPVYPLATITLVALILRSINVFGDLLYSLLAEAYIRITK